MKIKVFWESPACVGTIWKWIYNSYFLITDLQYIGSKKGYIDNPDGMARVCGSRIFGLTIDRYYKMPNDDLNM